MSVPESNFAAWGRKAEHDLLNIQNNLAASNVPWDTVCFHAQQAAEKLLKAFLIHHGTTVATCRAPMTWWPCLRSASNSIDSSPRSRRTPAWQFHQFGALGKTGLNQA